MHENASWITKKANRCGGEACIRETRITVWDSTAEARYMVLPMRPIETQDYSEEELAALVTRNGLIGTALL